MTCLVISGMMAAVFLFLLAMERLFPLRKRRRPFFPRLAVNLAISAVAFFIASTLVLPATLATAGWTSTKSFGVLAFFPLHPLAQAVLGFLLMDLAFYYWHLANHRVRFLWRFHNVHHIDPDLDISTAVRFHFGEIVLSTAFRVVQVSVIGVSAWMYFVYEVGFQANTFFQHSNVRLPIGIERLLNKVLVTPRMHGIHHSAIENETDSNYSTVLSWWDRVHGTLRLNVPQSHIRIGIPAYFDPEDNTIEHCLTLPFHKQREYWRLADGTIASRESDQLGPEKTLLAE